MQRMLGIYAAVALCLFAGVRKVHGADEPPLRAVGDVAVLGCHLLPRIPVVGKQIHALLRRGGNGQHADAVLARAPRTGRGEGCCDGDVEARVAVGLQLKACVFEREPVGVHGDGLAAVESDRGKTKEAVAELSRTVQAMESDIRAEQSMPPLTTLRMRSEMHEDLTGLATDAPDRARR